MTPEDWSDISNAAGFARSIEGRVLDSLMLGVTVHDHLGRLIHWNAPARELLAPTSSSDDLADPDVPAPTLRFSSGVLVIDAFHPATTALRYGRDVIDVGMKAVWQDGMSVALLVTAQVVPDLVVAGESAVVTTYLLRRDADEWQQAEMRTYTYAYDHLTGLLHRRGLVERLRTLLEAHHDGGRSVGCRLIDLDGMKRVNDSFGHVAGDDVLREMARRLSEVTPPPHAAARFGGNEFVVVLVGVTDLEAATALAENVRLALRRPLECLPADEERVVTASIGVTVATMDDSPEDVLRRADSATFHAKRDGRDRVVAVPPGAGREISG